MTTHLLRRHRGGRFRCVARTTTDTEKHARHNCPGSRHTKSIPHSLPLPLAYPTALIRPYYSLLHIIRFHFIRRHDAAFVDSLMGARYSRP
jgi:hypothetical protein